MPSASTIPIKNPFPRISAIALYFWLSVFNSVIKSALRDRISARKSSSRISRTVNAAFMARGLPPNVDPWLPGVMAAATASVAITAPMGKPPARPLAIAIISGLMPLGSNENKCPDRPTPIWTSSAISKHPTSSVTALNSAMNPSGKGLAPPSPCTVSTMTAAISGLPLSASLIN